MEHKINKITLVTLAAGMLFLGSLAYPYNARAQYYSKTEIKKSISIDKKIKKPSTELFLDNIDSKTGVFYDGDVIEFSINVENTGAETLNNIKIKDTLPKYLSLVFFPGTYNQKDNTIEWEIEKLEKGESKKFSVRAKINNTDQLSKTGRVKLTNIVESKNNDVNDKDTASYFVGPKTIPNTGDNTLIIKTIGVVLAAGAGLSLRKLARGY